MKTYNKNNSEKIKQQKRIYFEKNKEKILKENANWRQTLTGKFVTYRNSAKNRNVEWSLTKDEFSNFWGNKCYYCGDDICGIGIDRLNSERGYYLENIVPCCTKCNISKLDYTHDEFINKLKLIYIHLNL